MPRTRVLSVAVLLWTAVAGERIARADESPATHQVTVGVGTGVGRWWVRPASDAFLADESTELSGELQLRYQLRGTYAAGLWLWHTFLPFEHSLSLTAIGGSAAVRPWRGIWMEIDVGRLTASRGEAHTDNVDRHFGPVVRAALAHAFATGANTRVMVGVSIAHAWLKGWSGSREQTYDRATVAELGVHFVISGP